MSTSHHSQDINDIPSISLLPKLSALQKEGSFAPQEVSEAKLHMTVSAERPHEGLPDDPHDYEHFPDESPARNQFLENFGLRKDKKKQIQYDLENFEEIDVNVDISTGILRRLERKARRYEEEGFQGKDFQKESQSKKKFSDKQMDIEHVVQHPEFDKVDLVSQFISDLERPSLIKIEEIIKNAKNSFKEIEKEYVEFQKTQEGRLKGKESEQKALELMNEEGYPEEEPRGSNFQDESDHEGKDEQGENTQTLMELDISQKLKKLMSSLKKSAGKALKSQPKEGNRELNSERIRFEKNFKHFLKKKKNMFMQRSSISPQAKPKKTEPIEIESKPAKRRLVEHISKGELDLIQFFYEDIPKVENGCVLKSDFSKYLLSNPNILELYNLNPKNLVIELNSFPASNPNCLNLKEFIQFLKLPRDVCFNKAEFSKESISSMKRSLITDLPNLCLLSDEEIHLMRNVFKDLDKTGDLTVNRKLLISSLRKDLRISQILGSPAVYLPKCDKVLILDRVLHQIEREEFYGEEINRKAKESISWQHFIAHFLAYKRVFFISRELFHKIKRKIDLKTIFDDQELLDLSQENLAFFKEAFDSLEKTQENYVFVPDLLRFIRNHRKYEYLSQENARRASEKFSLPNENVDEVLRRLEKEADELLDWDEFLEFFSRRGRPKHFIIDRGERQRVYREVLDRVLPSKIHTKKFKTLKKKFCIEEPEEVEEEAFEEEEFKDSLRNENIRIEGYDSDPEYQQKQAKSAVLHESRFNKAKKFGFFGAIFRDNIDRENFKITIPQPFSFNERDQGKKKTISQVKLEQSLIDKDREELESMKVVFKAQTVPANVKDRHLWEKISKKMEERREEVRKHSKAMTVQTEKPFSFYFRDKGKDQIRRKNRQERERFQFKARPAPWFSSLKMMIDPQAKEMERKERIGRNANISLSLSRLPPRMEQYEKKRREIEQENRQGKYQQNPDIFTFRPAISGRVPDFKKLQKRLEDALESKKREFEPTVPVSSPGFSKSKKNVKREYLDVENEMTAKEVLQGPRRGPIERALKIKMSKPKIQASSTKKWQSAYDKRKQEIEEREKQRLLLIQEEEERKARLYKMKQKVQGSSAVVENKREFAKRKSELQSQIKSRIENDTKSYQLWKRALEERMDQKPLLLESCK